MTNRIEIQCRRNGMRLTGQRRLIAQVLSEATDHPDITQLYSRAAKRDKRVSLATVYRTVRRLEQAGIIERHAFGNGRGRFEHAAKKHHDHLIDIATGRIIEFSCPEIERLQRKIARQFGFRLIGHRLELYAKPVSRATNSATTKRPAV